jgi:hypothetical protein
MFPRESRLQKRRASLELLESRWLLSGSTVANIVWPASVPNLPRAAALPSVVSVALSGGTAYGPGVTPPTQSMLTSVAVKFNVAVTVKPDALSLRNLTTGATIAFSNIQLSYNATTHIAKWTFLSLVGGSLTDGKYQFQLEDYKIIDSTGRQIDGDRNGSAGGDYIGSISRLFGDADGNGAITASDMFAFQAVHMTTRGQSGYDARFDIDANGVIADSDRTADEARYGLVLSEMGAHAAAAAASDIAAQAPRPIASAATSDPHITTTTIQAKRKQSDPWKDYTVKTLPAGLVMTGIPALSKYGGDTAHKFTATGYFHLTKSHGKWWMVDPEGNRYFDNAVGVIGPRIFPDNAADFTSKFGTGQAGDTNWANWIRNWLNGIGYFSAGPWGTPSIQSVAGKKTNYDILLDAMATFAMGTGFGTFGYGHSDFRNGVIPVFDPAYPSFLNTYMSKVLPQLYPGLDTRNDPYLVGYMTDNELPWQTCTIDNYLALPATDVNRLAAKNWLAARGHTTPTDADRTAFQTYVAETYFRITAAGIRAIDPHHMVGCRFLGGDSKMTYLFRAAKKYLDLMTFNYYLDMDPAKGIESAAAAADMPWIASDIYVKGADSGMSNTTGFNFTVKTQADRGAYYQQMLISTLGAPHGVGESWLVLADNDLSNPEPTNQDANKGLMTVHFPLTYSDNPYKAMTDRIADLNRNLYPLADWLNRASISGSVFNDTNHDGVRQSSEPGLASWRIYLDANRNGTYDAGEISTLTTSSGTYRISSLPPGSFRIRQVRQSGWIQTKPTSGSYDVLLAQNQAVFGKDFGDSTGVLNPR